MLFEFNTTFVLGYLRLKFNFIKLLVLHKAEGNNLIITSASSISPYVIRNIYFQELSSFRYIFNRPRRVYMVGLGFKNFVLNNSLYILVGDCNYLIFVIPLGVKVLCKKNQIYVLSNNSKIGGDFISKIKKVKQLNLYKGKGVLEFRNFKFMKLKIGKKQKI